MQNNSPSGTQFWDDQAKAAQRQRAADRHRTLLHAALVRALVVLAITVSTLLARLAG